MNNMVVLFEEFILKAITLTESILASDFTEGNKLDLFTDNRERLFLIIDQISQQINWTEVDVVKRDELNRQIEFIKKLDEELLVRLQEYSIEVRRDIEKTYRQKENIKGYNLTDVK